MSGRASLSARAVAAEVLRQFDPRYDYAGPILDQLLGRTEERQRATDLVYGTVRNLRAIDAVIGRFSGRPTERIARPLLGIIRIAAYELAYHPATPTYSVVNEAVNVAKAVGGKKQTGFVNAVLRQIVRHIANRQADLSTCVPRRTLVRGPGAGCEFDGDFLPDPDVAQAAYLSTCFSLPTWLVDAWLTDFGPEPTRAICAGSNRRPSVYVRANLLKTTGRELLERFDRAGVSAELVPSEAPASGSEGDMLRIRGPQSVPKLPGFSEGLFTVQDLSASRAVRLLGPQPGWRILDLCAAPGTKTAQLAEAAGGATSVLATDIDADRLNKVSDNIGRLSLKNVTVVPYMQLEQESANPFDAILVDVPCSNTGVLAKRIEVRFRIKPAALTELAQSQRALLEKAASLTRPGGSICYSTCSIERQENQDVVGGFLADHGDFELAHEELTLPSAEGFDHDGVYVAVLRSRLQPRP